jgi:hypothetical protein
LRKALVFRRQQIARWSNTSELELLYQANYLELARQTPWLTQVPLSSAQGGTANYSLLFLLLSVLRDEPVHRVLEFGVGKSSQLITDYVRAFPDAASFHVEHDPLWLEQAVAEHPRVHKVFCALQPTLVQGRDINWYSADRPDERFDLIVVDGPPAFTSASRYARAGMLNWLPGVLADEFVLVVDDANRPGERWLTDQAESTFRAHGIQAEKRQLTAASTQLFFATPGRRSALYV